MGKRACLPCCLSQPWLRFLSPRSLLQPVLAAWRMAWQRKTLCESFWPETCRAQLRKAVFSIPHHHNPLFCPRSRIPARDGPTASSQALPVPWHMSCPWFPEPSKNKTRNTHTHFQLTEAPLLIRSLRPPQRLQSLFHNLTPPKGARGAREAKRLSPDREETKSSPYILYPVARKCPP